MVSSSTTEVAIPKVLSIIPLPFSLYTTEIYL